MDSLEGISQAFYGFYQGILTFERYKIKLYLAYKVINN